MYYMYVFLGYKICLKSVFFRFRVQLNFRITVIFFRESRPSLGEGGGGGEGAHDSITRFLRLILKVFKDEISFNFSGSEFPNFGP